MKIWLKPQLSKNEDHGIQSHHFMAKTWGNNGKSDRLFFGLQNHCRWWLKPWNSKVLAPWKKSYDQPSSAQLFGHVQLFATPWDCSMPGLPLHLQLPELAQTHVHWVGDVIQPSHPLSSPSPPGFNLSWHQGLFQWVISSHQVDKVLGFQLQHQSFKWTFRTDFL